MPDLKPCPFCGGPGALDVQRYASGTERWYPFCDGLSAGGHSCDASLGDWPTREQAIAAWNRRVPDARPLPAQEPSEEAVKAAWDKAVWLAQVGAACLIPTGQMVIANVADVLRAAYAVDGVSRPPAGTPPDSLPKECPAPDGCCVSQDGETHGHCSPAPSRITTPREVRVSEGAIIAEGFTFEGGNSEGAGRAAVAWAIRKLQAELGGAGTPPEEPSDARLDALRAIVKAGIPKLPHPWVALTEMSEVQLWTDAHDMLFRGFRAVCKELERRESLTDAERSEINNEYERRMAEPLAASPAPSLLALSDEEADALEWALKRTSGWAPHTPMGKRRIVLRGLLSRASRQQEMT